MDKSEKLIELGLRLKKLRESKGLTQQELAYRINKDHPSINRIEKGKVNPSFFTLLEICEGLELTIKDLFE